MKLEKTRRAVLQNRYPYVQKWGNILSSHQEFIDVQLEKADLTNAPTNVIYWHMSENRWKTTDDITSPSTRYDLGLEPIKV